MSGTQWFCIILLLLALGASRCSMLRSVPVPVGLKPGLNPGPNFVLQAFGGPHR